MYSLYSPSADSKAVYKCTSSVCITPEPDEAEDFSSIPCLAKCWNSMGRGSWVSLSLLTCQVFDQGESDLNPESEKAKHLCQVLWHLQRAFTWIPIMDSASVLFIKWTNCPPSLPTNQLKTPALLSMSQTHISKQFWLSILRLSANKQSLRCMQSSRACLLFVPASHNWYSIREVGGVWCMIVVCNFAFVLHLLGLV